MNKLICNENECTGCGACYNACPKMCISMIENEYGEMHPVINDAECINCNNCIKSCPNNTKVERNYSYKCFAAVRKNKDDMRRCASGGYLHIL